MTRRARTDAAKDARRQLLLKAALDAFFEKGFATARMDDIAARANVSKGTVYLYFDSKEALFTALIEDLAAPNLELIEAMAASAVSIEEALQRFATLAPMIIRTSDLPRLMKVLIGDSHLFPDIVRAYREQIIERVLGAISGLLERAMQRGEIAACDSALTARLMVAPIVLSGIWHAVFGGDAEAQVDLEALFALHVKIIESGLVLKGEST